MSLQLPTDDWINTRNQAIQNLDDNPNDIRFLEIMLALKEASEALRNFKGEQNGSER